MIELDCAVEGGGWPDSAECRAISERAIGAAARAVARHIPADAEVSLLFTDDRSVQALNAKWRNQDKPTNVLSFAANEGDDPQTPILGDIVLAGETIIRESREQGKTFNDHLSHLIIHGFLHLLGYDHIQNDKAEAMEQLEREICASLGIADPYAEH